MTFMRKILDALNMENWSAQKVIEEKEKKPEHPFEWEGVPDTPNQEENEKEEYSNHEKEKPYQYILFTERFDMSDIIGCRQDYMRRDYTIDPLYYISCQHINKLWRFSFDLLKTVKAKKFFESLEEFENLLYSDGGYIYGKFNKKLETEHYVLMKDEILINFLDKSFTNEYRNALELKTIKGRIDRIDHWFFMMDYYKKYLTPNSLSVLEALYKRWTMELMPNLLEKKD